MTSLFDGIDILKIDTPEITIPKVTIPKVTEQDTLKEIVLNQDYSNIEEYVSYLNDRLFAMEKTSELAIYKK